MVQNGLVAMPHFEFKATVSHSVINNVGYPAIFGKLVELSIARCIARCI